jgi:hypothetical protein
MKLDQTTRILFSPFNREVGNPRRWRIQTEDEFIRFIENNSGRADCFTSIYPEDHSIDKIFWDLDDPKGIVGCRDEAERLYSWLMKNGFNAIPILSGKKGFHIYLLLKSKQYENAKMLLTKATYSILYSVFGQSEDGKINTTRIDPSVIGDIRRISRIPNTLRCPSNSSFCTYLPEDWIKMDTVDLITHMKSPHVYEYSLDGIMPTLDDFPESPLEITERAPIMNTTPIQPIKDNIYLKNLLRPCLYRHMVMDEPRHDARVASTADLLGFFEPRKVFEIYRALGWTDWDPDETLKQIESCRNLRPYGCKKLKQLGIPEACCVG